MGHYCLLCADVAAVPYHRLIYPSPCTHPSIRHTQRSASNCLSPLMAPLAASDKEAVSSLVTRLLDKLTKGASYGER